MASKSRTPAKRKRSRALRALAALTACALLFFAYMYASARIVHVRYATVWLSDLPAQFDGTTILFVSDIDLIGANSAGTAARLLEKLALLRPDVLLLGGDYANPSLIDRLNGRDASDAALAALMADARGEFLSSLADFPAPLGKYAVSGDNDQNVGDISAQFLQAGIVQVDGAAIPVEKDGARIYIAGADAASAAGGAVFAKQDFVIALTHTPDSVAVILTTEAKDGGQWADLILTGHTHGGQMNVFGKTLLTLTQRERENIAGWKKIGDGYLLTSQGVGCESVNLRLDTQAEAHLITLRRKEAENGIPMQ